MVKATDLPRDPHSELQMKHETLGEIRMSPGGGDKRVATVCYNSRNIEVGICRDDQPLETTIALAAEVVGRLQNLDMVAKEVATAAYLEVYNNRWREETDPPLSEGAFQEKLSLREINVTGARMVEFFYDDEGMFAGHCVMVSSLQGIDFRKARAELFG